MRFLIKLLCLTLCLATGLLQAQQDSLTHRKYRASIDLGATHISFSGNNFLAKAYDFSLGWQLGLAIDVPRNFQTRYTFSRHNGVVLDQTLVGNIESVRSTQFTAGVNYQWAINDALRVMPEAQLGVISLRNTLNNRKFRDNGQFVGVGFRTAYAFSDWLSIFIDPGYRWYWLNIEAARQDQFFFETSQALIITFGLHCKL